MRPFSDTWICIGVCMHSYTHTYLIYTHYEAHYAYIRSETHAAHEDMSLYKQTYTYICTHIHAYIGLTARLGCG